MSFAIVNGQHLFGHAAMQHQMNMQNDMHYKMDFQQQCINQPFLNQDLTPEPFKNHTFRNEMDFHKNDPFPLIKNDLLPLFKSDPLPLFEIDPLPMIKHDTFSTGDFGLIKSDPPFLRRMPLIISIHGKKYFDSSFLFHLNN